MSDYVKWPLAAALACATLLGLLTLLVFGDGSFRQFDLDLFARLSAHQEARGGELGEAIAMLADPIPLVLLTIAACGIGLARRRPLDALAALVVVAGANVTTQLLKALFAHPRAQVLFGGSGSHQVAFPSGHTTAAFSVGVAFAFVLPRNLWPLTVAFALAFGTAVGCSVVVIAWHYPSDALGALFVAATWGFAALAGVRAAEPQPAPERELAPAGPLPSR